LDNIKDRGDHIIEQELVDVEECDKVEFPQKFMSQTSKKNQAFKNVLRPLRQ
jgi:hypothetical protein